MSWAANRETTRVEDIAYSLLGIFKVNMPLIYGEGERAFVRLQEEFIKYSGDESIFAWGLDTELASGKMPYTPRFGSSLRNCPILARSPENFKDCGCLQYGGKSESSFNMTNVGLQIELLLAPVPSKYQRAVRGSSLAWAGLLNCRVGNDSNSELVGLLLEASQDGKDGHFYRVQLRYSMSQASLLTKETIKVNERVAIQAVPTKIIISQEMGRESHFQVRKFVILDFPALQAMWYSATTGSRLGTSFSQLPVVVYWNVNTKILTASDSIANAGFYGFVFESSEGYPAFVVLTFQTNAVVRNAGVFYITENRKVREFLRTNSQPDDMGDLVLTDPDENEFRIVVKVTVKMVCHWKVLEVNVDAVGDGVRNALCDKEKARSIESYPFA